MAVEKISTVGKLLSYFSQTKADSEAAVHAELRLSYAQLNTEVDEIARALLAAGLKKGDRVGLLAPPGLDFYRIYLATVSVGGIWFGLNPRYQEPEYRYLLNDTSPAILFIVSPFEERDYSSELQSAGIAKTQYVVFGSPTKAAGAYSKFIEQGKRVGAEELRNAQADVQSEDTAAIVYTSGSTGEPKGAMLSHRAIVKSAIANAKWMGPEANRALCCLPINHVAALNNICMNVMANGGCVVFHESFDLGVIVETTKREKLTYMVTSPTLLMMLAAYEGFSISAMQSLNLIVFGGAATPENLIEQYQTIGAKLSTIYGLSETCGIVSHSDIDADLDVMANSIGKPIAGASWRVCAADGKELGVGESGEIQIAGPHILSGYFNKREQSAEAMTDDGFFRTGDLGKWRDDGNIEFTGRLKEMFKSGAYNVYPLEVEQAIEQSIDVTMAVVVAIPDNMYQEVGFAFVKPAPGKNLEISDLVSFLRTRIANYKIPKQFRVVNDFPTLPNTKIDRVKLKDMASDDHD